MTTTMIKLTGTPLHVHVGVATEHLADTLKAAASLVEPGKVLLDGDSWEEWGEQVSDSEANHVVVQVESLQAAHKVMRALVALGTLRRSQDSFAILWAITDSRNWATVLETDTGYSHQDL